MPLSYIHITESEDQTISYASLPLLSEAIESHAEQLRVFRNGEELDFGVGFTLTPETFLLTLEIPLVEEDKLTILRQTRLDRPYVDFKPTAPYQQAVELNLYTDQVLYLVQEFDELGEIVMAIGAFGMPVPEVDDADFSVIVFGSTGDTVSYASIPLISQSRCAHSSQLRVYKNNVLLTPTTDYVVDPVELEIILDDALEESDYLKIVRFTPRSKIVSPFADASPLSSDRILTNWMQLKHLIEECPFWPELESHILNTRRRPRPILLLKYSGPGDRFSFRGSGWTPDSTVFVYVNNIPLGNWQFTIDDWRWDIVLEWETGDDDQVVIVIQPPLLGNIGQPYFGGAGGEDGDGSDTNGSNMPSRLFIPTLVDQTEEDPVLVLNQIQIHHGDGTPDFPPNLAYLVFDLTAYRGKVAAEASLGLRITLWTAGIIRIHRTDATFSVTTTTPFLDIDGTDEFPWMVHEGLAPFVNAALAGDGMLYLAVESLSNEDGFGGGVFYASDSLVGTNVFGPRLSINEAAYPSQPWTPPAFYPQSFAASKFRTISEIGPSPGALTALWWINSPGGFQDGHHRFLLEFDLSAWVGKECQAATIAFDLQSFAPGATLRIRRCTRTNWVPSQTDWQFYRYGSEWQDLGAMGAADSSATGQVDWVVQNNPGRDVSPDISVLVNDALTNRGGQLLLLCAVTAPHVYVPNGVNPGIVFFPPSHPNVTMTPRLTASLTYPSPS